MLWPLLARAAVGSWNGGLPLHSPNGLAHCAIVMILADLAMYLGLFKLDLLVTSEPKAASNFSLGLVTSFSPSPLTIVSLQQHASGTELAQKTGYGNYVSDMASPKYTLSWPSWRDFESFRRAGEETSLVERRRIKVTSGGQRYNLRTHYVCSRHGMGNILCNKHL